MTVQKVRTDKKGAIIVVSDLNLPTPRSNLVSKEIIKDARLTH